LSRDGSGVYSLPPGSTIANGDVSDATDLNTPLADIETDLNTARPIVAGGTGATTAGDARTNLGVAIGTDVQAHDDFLDDIAALTDPGVDRALIWDDSASGIAFAPLGMQFIESTNASDDTAISFTTGFDATLYDAYLFVLGGVVPATDAGGLFCRTSTDGGGTYDNTAGDYQHVRTIVTSTSATSDGNTTDAIHMLIATNVGSDTGEHGVSGYLLLTMPHRTRRAMITGQVTYMTASDTVAGSNFFGFRDAAADVDGLQFRFTNGNIEEGVITVYGLRNA